MKYKLKPCPFCGSTHILLLPSEKYPKFHYPTIICEACLAAVQATSDEKNAYRDVE